MTETCDVAIVGGSVVGSATAYFLLAQTGFKGRVVVIERDSTYADAATSRSVGGVRQQFSTPENISMSTFGAAFIRNADDYLSVEPYALALLRGDNDYRLAVDRALSHIYRSGEIGPIFERTFGGKAKPTQILQTLYLISGLPD